jgi:hypothetical protein
MPVTAILNPTRASSHARRDPKALGALSLTTNHLSLSRSYWMPPPSSRGRPVAQRLWRRSSLHLQSSRFLLTRTKTQTTFTINSESTYAPATMARTIFFRSSAVGSRFIGAHGLSHFSKCTSRRLGISSLMSLMSVMFLPVLGS